MVKHLLVLLWALAFAAGLTAIVSTYYRYRQERLDLLRHYLRYLLLANASVGATLVMTYLAANVDDWQRWIDREPAVAAFVLSSFWLVARQRSLHGHSVIEWLASGRPRDAAVRLARAQAARYAA